MGLMAADDNKPMSGRTPFTDLVRHRRSLLGLSFERLASRCIDAGTGKKVVSASWLHRLESAQPVAAPDLTQLQGLAVGLQVPVAQLQEAAGEQFFGIE